MVKRGSEWGLGEAGCVGSGLGSQLGKIEIRTSFVAHIHRLVELALGPDAVEDDGVDGDCDYFNDYFDEGADESPILGSTGQL